MPYIKEEQRQEIMDGRMPADAGELNYFLTMCLLNYITEHTKDAPNYAMYNEVIGVLECLKLEFYRRAVAPYEDVKSESNGDVFSENSE